MKQKRRGFFQTLAAFYASFGFPDLTEHAARIEYADPPGEFGPTGTCSGTCGPITGSHFLVGDREIVLDDYDAAWEVGDDGRYRPIANPWSGELDAEDGCDV